MKRITALGIVLSLLLFFSFTTSSFAGTEPSPFRAEIGAYRLNFVEGYALTASQMVKAVLSTPPDDVREVNAIKRLSRQLNKLKALMSLTAIDVIRFQSPPDDSIPGAAIPPDDQLPAINELSAIAGHAQAMMEAIRNYGHPPEPCHPGFADALDLLLESAEGLHDSALNYLGELTADVTDVIR